MYIRFKQGERFFFIIIIGDDLRQCTEATKTPKNIFGAVIIAEILFQLFVNRCVRRNDKEILYVVLGVQISNKSAHQTCFANTCCECKGQRHEITFKIRANRIHSVDSAQCRFQIHALAEHHAIYDFLQYFQRLLLRLAQGHNATDIVRGVLRKIIIHHNPPRHIRRHTPADAQCSGYSPSCQTHSG